MIFGEFRCAEAEGLTLAHTLTLTGRTLKKGRVLDAADVAVLAQAGIETVAGARLEAGDLSEDAAAGEVAARLVGTNCAARPPYTGRANIHATVRGVVVVDADAIHRANRIDPAMTIGTLPPWTLARYGQVIATVKIIPFAVPRRLIDACTGALDEPPLRVAELLPHRVALIASELPGMKGNAVATAMSATRQRLEALGSRLAIELVCPHQPAALEAALRQAIAAGCEMILIAGATVAKDPGDVVPNAIVKAGGTLVRFGLPVEPGNMLVLARIGAIPVIVLPGCARSRRLNGLDWVLHRLLAKLPVTSDDLAVMGVGGLIRSTPADDAGGDEAPGTTPPAAKPVGASIAALVLAAGRSSRMGGANKLLEPVDGVPMALRAVSAALASRATSVTVVTGHEAGKVEALVAGPRVSCVHNPDYATGMSTSLRCGLAALPADADGVIVILADMPRINAGHLDALIEAFAAQPGIIVPMQGGRRGNPIVWPRRHFAAMQAIAGDQGARQLLAQHAEQIVAVEVDSDAIFADVDTPESLAALRGGTCG